MMTITGASTTLTLAEAYGWLSTGWRRRPVTGLRVPRLLAERLASDPTGPP